MRLDRPLLISVALAAALALPSAAAAGPAGDGGVQAVEQPFLGAVRDSSSSGGTTGGAESGGPSVSDRPERPARRRRARRRRHGGSRRGAERRDERRTPRRRESGGLRPTPPREPPAVAEPEPAPVAGEDGHFFPVAGRFDLGDKDARFGAKRPGHVHQGQDIAAAEGTPVVAPFSGIVEWVRYQRRGAGWYIVLDGAGEDRDYVFMHLRRGSLLVTVGERVRAGEKIAEVGNTGASSGPHLHFEVWVGGWFEKGGRPIDPLPLLEAWL